MSEGYKILCTLYIYMYIHMSVYVCSSNLCQAPALEGEFLNSFLHVSLRLLYYSSLYIYNVRCIYMYTLFSGNLSGYPPLNIRAFCTHYLHPLT